MLLLQKKIIDFLYRLTQQRAFKKALGTLDITDPIEVIQARNRHFVFNTSADDFSFTEAPRADQMDKPLLERICRAYALAKEHQPKDGPLAVGEHWAEILDREYGFLRDAASSGDYARLNEFFSFMFIRKTYGLSMSGTMPDTNDPKSVELYINRYMAQLLSLAAYFECQGVSKDMDNEYYVTGTKLRPAALLEDIFKRAHIEPHYPQAGSPTGLRMNNGVIVPYVALRHMYLAHRAAALAGDSGPVRIAEIGGGNGGVLYFLSRMLKAQFTLADFDIPEICAISGYFLSKAIPGAEIVLYGEQDVSRGLSSSGSRIYVLPNWTLRNMPADSFNLVMNADSFPEMPRETVLEYLSRISECGGLLYSYNQDCGTHGQTRLSQIDWESMGFGRLAYHPAWLRHGYFERVFYSKKQASTPPAIRM